MIMITSNVLQGDTIVVIVQCIYQERGLSGVTLIWEGEVVFFVEKVEVQKANPQECKDGQKACMRGGGSGKRKRSAAIVQCIHQERGLSGLTLIWEWKIHFFFCRQSGSSEGKPIGE